jgi:hypothetical protein
MLFCFDAVNEKTHHRRHELGEIINDGSQYRERGDRSGTSMTKGEKDKPV